MIFKQICQNDQRLPKCTKQIQTKTEKVCSRPCSACIQAVWICLSLYSLPISQCKRLRVAAQKAFRWVLVILTYLLRLPWPVFAGSSGEFKSYARIVGPVLRCKYEINRQKLVAIEPVDCIHQITKNDRKCREKRDLQQFCKTYKTVYSARFNLFNIDNSIQSS